MVSVGELACLWGNEKSHVEKSVCLTGTKCFMFAVLIELWCQHGNIF